MPDSQSTEPLPSVDALQFRRAQPLDNTASPKETACVACKRLISGEYYQVQNQVICADCAVKIEAGRQAQKPVPLLRPAIYGFGAALGGCLLYAAVLAMGVQIGIVALAVGWMVGKAIRKGSYGLGGRPQQILAVTLTYFAISASIVPAFFFMGAKKAVELRSASKGDPPEKASPLPAPRKSKFPGGVVVGVLVLATVSPFLELGSSPVGGLISLFILFVGLQRAWALTARHEILVTGPYPCSPTSP